MLTDEFNYELPTELIAQTPASSRDASRLLVLHRGSERIEHRRFPDFLQYLHSGDVLVLNDSRVIPARLRANNTRTGGRFELLLLEEMAVNDWWCLVHPGKRATLGLELEVADASGRATGIHATVLERNPEGHRRLQFVGVGNIAEVLGAFGEVPLPPYIRRPEGPTDQDKRRYQTVFAQAPGSVAAPTAGLHFTPELLASMGARGIEVCFVTLHVGLATFKPVKTEMIEAHPMHEERYEVPADLARRVNAARGDGRRVVAVGTTVTRVLESVAAEHGGQIVPGSGRTRLFIHPPRQFAVAGALLTNFHLPRSTLLMLVSAFASPGQTRGIELVRSAYAEAVRERYRFFSYGDAMLVV